MKITLRRANSLQEQITKEINKIPLVTSVIIDSYRSFGSQIEPAAFRLGQNLESRENLRKAFYAIRSAVGSANVLSGISDLLTTAAHLDKTMADYSQLANSSEVLNEDLVKGKLELQQNRAKISTYSSEDGIPTGILSANLIIEYKTKMQELQKSKISLNDKVLELNIKTEIALADDVVGTLQAFNLI